MIHFILLPIGFALGWYVAATISRWKLEDTLVHFEREIERAKQQAEGCASGEQIHQSRAPFSIED